MWNITFEWVNAMTNRIMGWYGFTHDSDYPLMEIAVPVAVELIRRGVTVDTLTHNEIESADQATGGKMRTLFDTMHPARA